MELAKRLLHERNLSLVHYIANLEKKHKRVLMNTLKDLDGKGMNVIFPQFNAISIGEFCTTQTLLKIIGDNKKRFNEVLENRITSQDKRQKIEE